MTLNLLCGLTGVTYANTVNGPSNTRRPCLEPGDIIIMDNCPFHHNERGEILEDFLNELNIELVYMPCNSLAFNPAEYVFGKIKTLMKYRVWDLTNANLIESLYTAINSITLGNMHEFFRVTGYLQV